MAIVGYCNRLKISITEDQSKRVGIAVSKYCRDHDINYGKASIGEGAENHKWDQVNCYPRSVLDMWRNGEIKVKDLRIENNKITDDAVPKPKLFTHNRNYWY